MALDEKKVYIVVHNGDVCHPSLVVDDASEARKYCAKENAKWPALQFRVLSIREYGDSCYQEGYTSGYDEGVSDGADIYG